MRHQEPNPLYKKRRDESITIITIITKKNNNNKIYRETNECEQSEFSDQQEVLTLIEGPTLSYQDKIL